MNRKKKCIRQEKVCTVELFAFMNDFPSQPIPRRRLFPCWKWVTDEAHQQDRKKTFRNRTKKINWGQQRKEEEWTVDTAEEYSVWILFSIGRSKRRKIGLPLAQWHTLQLYSAIVPTSFGRPVKIKIYVDEKWRAGKDEVRGNVWKRSFSAWWRLIGRLFLDSFFELKYCTTIYNGLKALSYSSNEFAW